MANLAGGRGKPMGAPAPAHDLAARAAGIAVVVAALLLLVFAYHVGKDCGAWEARQRLRGEPRPTLCFTGP
jgi:hypothetical protein